jgi:putative SOS response-associated peptidase YedK
MCNLYSMTTNAEAIRRLFAVDPMRDRAGNLPSIPGVFPDYPAPIVRNADGGRELAMARWGPVRTERITGAPVGIGFYEIALDGTLLIDWRAIEAPAEGPADRPPTSVAKALLAVRDGKWKPMNR